MTTIKVTDRQFLHAYNHLFRGSTEQVAFLYCEWHSSHQITQLTCDQIYPVPKNGFVHQSKYHIHLTDEIRQYVIKRAWDENRCLVELHSHRDSRYPASFSLSDLSGFEEFVPHVRWRLKYRPYGALVLTQKNYDALIWNGESIEPQPLTALQLDQRQLLPTNHTIDQLRKKP